MSKTPIFVVSLRDRLDRRSYLEKHFSILKVKFDFVDALKPENLPLGMQNSAIACWASHVKALKKFLLTNEKYGLILEDDVDVDHELAFQFFKEIDKVTQFFEKSFGIIQLVTVDLSSSSKIRRSLQNFYSLIFGFCSYQRPDRQRMRDEIGILESIEVEKALKQIFKARVFPLFGFTLGSQAYLITRRSAEWMISNFNSKTDWDETSRFSIDTWLDEKSRNSNYPPEIMTLRLSKQILPQRVTASDNNYYPAAETLNKSGNSFPNLDEQERSYSGK